MDITSKDLISLSDNVLVLPIEEEIKGELIIPDGAKSKPQYGHVKAIGENKDGVKAGDFVLYRQFAGLQQEIDGIPHLIMKQNDLLMVIPERKDLVASDGAGI
jgi:chaperonin GroES